jgi:polar amino acid transport system ATP-binding protein
MAGGEMVLKVEDLQKRFAGNQVLNGVSFEIDRGQIKVICGPSGFGASTIPSGRQKAKLPRSE